MSSVYVFFKTFVPPSLCLALFTLAPKLQSEIVTWSVGQSQNPPVWSDKKNWSPEQLPDGGDRVILPVGASPILDIDAVVDELLLGEVGAGRVATITSQDKQLTVNSLTKWDNGVLAGAGFLNLLDSWNFNGKAQFGGWTVNLNGNGTAINTSFTISHALNVNGYLRVGTGSSFKGANAGELKLSGVLDMDSQTGPGQKIIRLPETCRRIITRQLHSKPKQLLYSSQSKILLVPLSDHSRVQHPIRFHEWNRKNSPRTS